MTAQPYFCYFINCCRMQTSEQRNLALPIGSGPLQYLPADSPTLENRGIQVAPQANSELAKANDPHFKGSKKNQKKNIAMILKTNINADQITGETTTPP